MYDLRWDTKYDPETTGQALDQIEAKLKVALPTTLRYLLTNYSSLVPKRNGERAIYVVLKDQPNGSYKLVADFHGFCTPSIEHPTIDWLDSYFKIGAPKVVPFGTNGSSPLFLNYEGDATNSNPSVWDTYMEGETLEESWWLVAPDVDTFFSNLKTKKEAIALGIEFPY